MRIEFVSPHDPPAELVSVLGQYFRAFYSVSPWDECWRCPRCSPDGDYGTAGRYGEVDFTVCPECGSPLEAYWSDQRTQDYLQGAMAQPGAFLIVGWDRPEDTAPEGLVAWMWGYDLPPVLSAALPAVGTCRYVDIVGVIPEYRGTGTQQFTRACADMMIIGYDSLITHTHSAARHVHDAARRSGWDIIPESEQPHSDDPDRDYWILRA